MTKWEGYAFSVFADLGNVWLLDSRAQDALTISSYASYEPPIRIGTGLGLQILTPVGPFQFDVALNPQAAFARGQQRILLREQFEEPPLRVHLTLGDIW
jgi:outer membrane protein assembly factor BamA